MQPSPASEVEAANGALVELGEAPIADFTGSKRAIEAGRAFGRVRDLVLSEVWWQFAKGYEVPSALPAAPAGTQRLLYRYALSPECIKVREVNGLDERSDSWEVVAARPADGAVKVLACIASSPPQVVTTIRIGNVALWTPEFLNLFQLRLAAAVGPLIGKDKETVDGKTAAADALVSKYSRHSAQERARKTMPRYTSWHRSRSVGPGWR